MRGHQTGQIPRHPPLRHPFEICSLTRAPQHAHPVLRALTGQLPAAIPADAAAGAFRCYTEPTLCCVRQSMQVNYLGPYLLTRLLEPALAAGAPSRVVNVSSIMSRFGEIENAKVRGASRLVPVATSTAGCAVKSWMTTTPPGPK
jgi:NAD(P)-dependent dehydrogenase (short-subunit alcohol dehydrogenase family)